MRDSSRQSERKRFNRIVAPFSERSMIGSSGVVTNAAESAVSTVKGFQFHGCDVGVSKGFADGGVNLVEISRANVTLDHRDVRTVCRIEGEAFREGLEQAGVVRF